MPTEQATSLPPIERPAWLPPDQWPYEIRTVPAAGGRLAVTDAGQGPALVLVHAGTWSFLWRQLIDRLSSDFRVVALDPPSMGLSDDGPGAGLEQVASAVDGVVRTLDLHDLVLVMHDLGGPASLEAASQWPDRVSGIVAINTFGWAPAGPLLRGMLAIMGSPATRELHVWSNWLLLLMCTRFGVGRHLDGAARRTFRRGMSRRGKRSFHRLLSSARHHDYAVVNRGRKELMDRPVLTIFGERNDPGRFQERWRAEMRDVDSVVVPRGYHFPMCDDPDLVAQAIRDWYRSRVAR